MVSAIPIYTGFWSDRAFDSAIRAATLTLPIREANYLITFLALLVTVCGSFVWIIVAFVLHQLLAHRRNVDAFGIQQQVGLRNSSSPIGLAWQSAKLLLAWRRSRPSGLVWRMISVALPALLVWVTFVVASIFVAEVASKDNEQIQVLAKEGTCGFYISQSDTKAALADSMRKGIDDTVNARQYARSWYANNGNSVTAQTLFPATRLPYNTNTATACPWRDRCILGPSTAFSLETALLDSHAMFGINAEPSKRIKYQKNVTCSVVDVQDLQERIPDVFDAFDTSGKDKWIRFYMGNVTVELTESNITYQYFMETIRGSVGYLVYPLLYQPGGSNATWKPTPPFDHNDSDLTVFFISQNAIQYNEPTFDPLYYANGTYTGSWGVEPNNWVNVMACTDRYRLCNPANQACSAWSGLTQQFSELNVSGSLGLNPEQIATASRVLLSSVNTDTHSSVARLGANALLAQDYVDGGISAPLPDNQWQLEVTRWFETSLAKLQAYVISYARNDATVDGAARILTPASSPDDPPGLRAALETQCVNQRIQSSGQVQSFSTLGLFLVVAITVIFGLVATTLEKCVALFRQGNLSEGEIALQADDHLHLLRMAMENDSNEGQQENAWSNSTLGVPVRRAGVSVARPVMGLNRLSAYPPYASAKDASGLGS